MKDSASSAPSQRQQIQHHGQLEREEEKKQQTIEDIKMLIRLFLRYQALVCDQVRYTLYHHARHRCFKNRKQAN